MTNINLQRYIQQRIIDKTIRWLWNETLIQIIPNKQQKDIVLQVSNLASHSRKTLIDD